jgi:rfaE bifunctional protein kinase chain/domain
MNDSPPLDAARLDAILSAIPRLTIAVVGDLFLDRYLDLDAQLTEPSLETGLDAYQVVAVRSYPGAAGTVINNLAALGVRRICPLAVIGDDGEGYELRQALSRMPAVDPKGLIVSTERRTPTYTKPMLCERGRPPRELNRLDIKNRRPVPEELENQIVQMLRELWPEVDAMVVLDQVSENDCGVVSGKVREALAELATQDPEKFVLADSRERIGLFRGICLKPNRHETLLAMRQTDEASENELQRAVCHLARAAGRWVFCTDGARGILLASPQDNETVKRPHIPAVPVHGPIDIVGAGDSTSAALTCAMAAGVGVEAAAAFGNLAASITIQQLGTTGTASPHQIRQRWREATA